MITTNTIMSNEEVMVSINENYAKRQAAAMADIEMLFNKLYTNHPDYETSFSQLLKIPGPGTSWFHC